MVIAALLAAAQLAAAPISDPGLIDLIETADLSSLTISPDGAHVAFRQDQASVMRDDRRLSWWIADLDAARPARLLADGGGPLWTPGGTLPPEPAQWSADGRWLYYRALIGDQVQVWRAAADRSVIEQVTHDEANIVRFRLTADGARLSFDVGPKRAAVLEAEARAAERGVRIDNTVDPAQNLFAAAQIEGRPAAQRLSGPWFGRTGILGDAVERTVTVDLTAGGFPVLDTIHQKAATTTSNSATPWAAPRPQIRASPDGFGQAVLTPEDGPGRLSIIRPNGAALSCPPSACDGDRIVAVAWRPGHDQLLVTIGDPARRQSLRLWDLAAGSVRSLAPAEGLIGGGGLEPCAVDRRQAVCVTAAADAPPALVRIDLEEGTLRPLATPNTGPSSRRPPPELVQWRDEAGRAYTGWLLSPSRDATSGPTPLFVTYYLCDGYLRGGVGDEYPLAAFAQARIAALCINRAPGSARNHDAVGDYQVGLSAVRSAIAFLAARNLIDPKRVGMGGFSFGSEVTTWIAMRADLLAAAAIASTQIEPAYYWLNAAAGRDNPVALKQSWKLGSPDETPKRWREVSPALNADRITAPLLMQLPEQEYRFSFELFARLSRSTTPVDLYVFPGEPHIKVRPRHRLAVYQRNLDWFRFWLQDYVDPDPAKAAQYALWRSMAAARAPRSAPARPGPTVRRPPAG